MCKGEGNFARAFCIITQQEVAAQFFFFHFAVIKQHYTFKQSKYVGVLISKMLFLLSLFDLLVLIC